MGNLFQTLSFLVLLAFWIYLLIFSYRYKNMSPWKFGVVIVGILVSGINYSFYDNQIIVFSISLPLVVSLAGILWNSNNTLQQFHVKNIGELLRYIFIGIVFGLLLESFSIIAQVPKNFEVPTEYTTIALVAIGIQTSVAEEFLFRGYLLSYLRKCEFNRFFTITFQALMFAALHVPLYFGNWISLLIIFLIGWTGGFLTWKNNNLISAIALHMTFNFSGIIWWLTVV
jgi:membrane protease YdiL (CAAX protease family)